MNRKKVKLAPIVMLIFLLWANIAPSFLAVAETVSQQTGKNEQQEMKTLPSDSDGLEKESSSESVTLSSETEEKENETKVDKTDDTVSGSSSEKSENVARKVEQKNKSLKKVSKKLTILGTSDVHGNVWDWSYEDNKQDNLGFAKIGTIVKQVRASTKNTILVDAGDNLQGTLLTDDLYSSKPEFLAKEHPVITAMNTIGYDSMSLGNHEFNFGLDLIKKAEREAKFPLLSANTYVSATGDNFVDAYKIKEVDGIKVAIIGLTIPHVPQWDGDKVATLTFTSLRAEAKKQVAIIKETEDVDIIVAAIHAGLQNSDPEAAAENVIKEVPEIAAFVLGHDHREYAEMIADNTGKEKPVAAVKDTGTGVVRIDLELEKDDSDQEAKWQVVNSQPSIIPVTTIDSQGNKVSVATDEAVRAATQEAHIATQNYVNDVIGEATGDFLPENEIPGIPEAQLQPTAMISLINRVQMEVTEADIAAGALFRADSDLKKGPITFASVFNIYKYPNTLVGANMTGKQLKAFIEKQASYYQQYKPGDLTIGFNPNIRVYNYDIVTGVQYKIDISKKVGERIIDLKFKGKDVTDDQPFKIAINNYRFEGMVKDKLVDPEPYYESDPATLRGKIVEYIKETRNGVIKPEDEIENSFEIVGADLNHPLRKYVIEQIKAGAEGFDLIKASSDGRTPNVEKVNINKLIAEGKIPQELLGESFTIMHTNDMHGRLGFEKDKSIGMAKLKTFKDEMKPTLMLDGGDSLQGLALSNFSEGMDMAKAMSHLPYDGVAAGNHEFDFGYDRAMAYKELLPMISANVTKEGKPSFETHKIIKKEGKKFAVIGLSTPETAYKTHPKNVEGVTFADPIPVAKTMINQLTDQADVFIFVTHLGIDKTTPEQWRGDTLAKELAKAYPKTKIIIIDGHSHTELKEGQVYGNVLLAQTGNYLNNVGMIDVSYQGDQVSYKARLVPAKEFNDVVDNPAVKEIVAETQKKFAKEMSTTVLEDNPVFFEGDGNYGRTRETNLGNIIGDALYDYGQTGFSSPSDFAVINGGGIRVDINKGKVTKGDILAVLPFGNTIAQIDVTGQQIYEMFEHSLRSEVQKDKDGNIILDEKGLPALGKNGGYLQVSKSVNLIYDANLQGAVPEKNIEGKRVLRVQLMDRKTDKFKDVKREQTYKVTTNDFLAAGGDGYKMLGGKSEEGPSMDQIFTTFLQNIAKSNNQKVVAIASGKYSLTDYQEPFPYSRIVPMTEAAYKELIASEGEQLDLTKLRTEIKAAQKLVKGDYTVKSWETFALTLKAAEDLLAQASLGNTKTTQAELDKMTEDLQAAVKDLKKPSEPTGLNTQALVDAIAVAKKLNQAAYTTESWQHFEGALKTAEALLAKSQINTTVTQGELGEAVKALNDSISKLIPRKKIINTGNQSTGTSNKKPTLLPKTGEEIYYGVVQGLGIMLVVSYGYKLQRKRQLM